MGDEPRSVRENVRRAAATGGFDAAAVARVAQEHGARVVPADAAGPGVRADALVVERGKGAAAVVTADCVPLVIAGRDELAVVHAGWRGLVAGVVDAAAAAVRSPVAAWIGPSIRDCCYEVGPEVVEAFLAAGLPTGSPGRVDPPGAAEAALARGGIVAVATADICTSCSPDYFSYRRDGVTGRQGGFAGWM